VWAKHGAHGGEGTEDPLTRKTIRLAVTLFSRYFIPEGTIGQGTKVAIVQNTEVIG
jgi:hypothetical protein